MPLLLQNTLTYGAARASRALAYAFVAWWYGLSSSADLLLFLFAVAMYMVNVTSRVLGEIMVHRLGAVPGRLVLSLGVLGVVSWLISPLISFILFGIAASLLSGVLAGRGTFLIPPAASLLASCAFVGVAVLFWRSPEPMVLIRAIALGEWIRLLVLMFFSRRLPQIPFRELLPALRASSVHFLALSMFALPPVLARIYASWLGEGQVASFSYAAAASGYLILFFTAGLVVTKSYEWKALPALRVVEEAFGMLHRFAPRALLGSGLLFSVLFAAYYVTEFELMLVTTFLIPGLVFYYAAAIGYTALAVLGCLRYVLISASVYVFVSAGLSFAFMEVHGLAGIAIGLTLSQVIAAVLLMFRVWAEGRILERVS